MLSKTTFRISSKWAIALQVTSLASRVTNGIRLMIMVNREMLNLAKKTTILLDFKVPYRLNSKKGMWTMSRATSLPPSSARTSTPLSKTSKQALENNKGSSMTISLIVLSKRSLSHTKEATHRFRLLIYRKGVDFSYRERIQLSSLLRWKWSRRNSRISFNLILVFTK